MSDASSPKKYAVQILGMVSPFLVALPIHKIMKMKHSDPFFFTDEMFPNKSVLNFMLITFNKTELIDTLILPVPLMHRNCRQGSRRSLYFFTRYKCRIRKLIIQLQHTPKLFEYSNNIKSETVNFNLCIIIIITI
jgi:hypothetical protein